MKSKKNRTIPKGALYKNVVNLWEAIPKTTTDPAGSYTGIVKDNPKEQPQQDADDL